MRSHPPTLITLARRTLFEECAVGRGDRILVAVSGGGDSCALLDVLARLAERGGFALIAHGVDHGLRAEAAAELDLAERLARAWGVPFSRSHLCVAPGSNLQARARRARYAALRAAASRGGATLVATAHHADDRAETVLLRLLRGAGPRGLSVLPPRSGELIRPLVRARRRAVMAHLGRHCIAHADDPSNRDRRYLRTRVRFELLPLLESLSPEVVGHLCALADQLAAEPAPLVLDEAGRAIELGRAQQQELRRVRRLGLGGARIRLRGGRELRFDPRTGRVVVAPVPPVKKNARPKGAAKASTGD
jgi:tRNA(Ile)-lysidine synthase